MLTLADIISLPIPSEDYERILKHSKNAEIGGISHIRSTQQRSYNLSTDQLVGQLGTYAVTKYLFGNAATYFELREKADKNPHLGDGGEDIKGKQVDVKTSLMRGNPNPLAYRLAVRPRERHANWRYILTLIKDLSQPVSVLMIGWAWDRQLDGKMETNGVFDGAFTITAKNLNPIPKKT